ncbi:MAG: LytTR family DNA-binding domain-containing protein [Propionibacteriaceae bacterium]|jgi:DNA-binding LytR/AlgR family response regulator|nr:LytTR family DNA-binding domain-containing protein [Propionibacteriaceae bacterium]
MIRVGVVEDDERSKAEVLGHLARFERESAGRERFTVTVFSDGSELVASYRLDFDILFLDIKMERLDGMSAARQIREVDSDVVIIFITNSPHYAINGYSVGALSYLLKPVTYTAFSGELKRSLTLVSKRERHTVMLSFENEKHRVDIADVCYLESYKHQITAHTLSRPYAAAGPLRALEEELGAHGFFRINSGYLVNLRHVTGIRQSAVLLRGGRELQVSRARKQAFLVALADYIGDARGTVSSNSSNSSNGGGGGGG